jgi:uroporphyrinogen III methyltransferase / synthase
LNADLVPSTSFSAEGLAADLADAVRGRRVLLAKGRQGRDVLRQELSRVSTVGEVVVYEQADSLENATDTLDALRRGEIRYVTLSSPNIARALLRQFDDTIRGRVERGEIELVAISATTAAAVAEFGLPVAAQARRATMEGLVEELVRMARSAEPASV